MSDWLTRHGEKGSARARDSLKDKKGKELARLKKKRQSKARRKESIDVMRHAILTHLSLKLRLIMI